MRAPRRAVRGLPAAPLLASGFPRGLSAIRTAVLLWVSAPRQRHARPAQADGVRSASAHALASTRGSKHRSAEVFCCPRPDPSIVHNLTVIRRPLRTRCMGPPGMWNPDILPRPRTGCNPGVSRTGAMGEQRRAVALPSRGTHAYRATAGLPRDVVRPWHPYATRPGCTPSWGVARYPGSTFRVGPCTECVGASGSLSGCARSKDRAAGSRTPRRSGASTLGSRRGRAQTRCGLRPPVRVAHAAGGGPTPKAEQRCGSR